MDEDADANLVAVKTKRTFPKTTLPQSGDYFSPNSLKILGKSQLLDCQEVGFFYRKPSHLRLKNTKISCINRFLV